MASNPLDDPLLEPFLNPSFEAVQYLNSVLPIISASPLSNTPGPIPQQAGSGSSLPDVSAKTQALLSQLSAQTAKLSSAVTADTDDLLRHGPRLAFEVDSLAEEVAKLNALFDDLGGHRTHPATRPFSVLDELLSRTQKINKLVKDSASSKTQEPGQAGKTAPADQENYLSTLQSLYMARTRLDGVIRLFGEATKWRLPEMANGLGQSSADPFAANVLDEEDDLIAIDPFVSSLKAEIALCVTEPKSVQTSQADRMSTPAGRRIQALSVLTRLWKGTAEEKIRARVIDELKKLAFDDSRRRERDRLRANSSSLKSPPRFLEDLISILDQVEESK